MRQGKEAPIPLAELFEVTAATLAIEEAIRTQKSVPLHLNDETSNRGAPQGQPGFSETA
jgi:hypothetical protein